MDMAANGKKPPSKLLLALEMRGIWELQAFFALYPLLRRAPRGATAAPTAPSRRWAGATCSVNIAFGSPR